MSGRSLAVKRRRRPELPLVPLIDVLVMLVLFAFVTMRFSVNQIRNLTLPKITTAGKNQLGNSVTITIEKDGRLTINGRFITDDQLNDQVVQIANVDKETPILLKADQDSQLKKIAYVWDTLRRAGLSTIRIQSQ
jgi:biopolymer transport protein ExbD